MKSRALVFLLLFAMFTPGSLAEDDLIYDAVDPCRVADTRKSSEGVIVANTVREFQVFGSSGELAVQGGEVDCVHPKQSANVSPVAVAAYVIAIRNGDSSGNGALSLYPSNLPTPAPGSGTTVNFFDVNAIGNTTIARVCDTNCPAAGELAVLARTTDRDVVIDIQGYFYSARDPVLVPDHLQFGRF